MGTESGSTRRYDGAAVAKNSTARWSRSGPAFTSSAALLKGTLDRIVAFLALLLLAPLLLAIAVALRFEGGPVFVRQDRVGVNGRRFRTVVFRSSSARVGPLLRRYALADLPQLLNVAGGSMSLVGPRPPLVGEATTAPAVKPGLTGLVEPGEPVETWEDARQLELRYANEWSPALDARILARSIRTALHENQAA